MNRYLNNVRIPTSNTHNIHLNSIELAGDDFITRHGRDGKTSDQAYTLSRLRKEERLLQAGYPLENKLDRLNLGLENAADN